MTFAGLSGAIYFNLQRSVEPALQWSKSIHDEWHVANYFAFVASLMQMAVRFLNIWHKDVFIKVLLAQMSIVTAGKHTIKEFIANKQAFRIGLETWFSCR